MFCKYVKPVDYAVGDRVVVFGGPCSTSVQGPCRISKITSKKVHVMLPHYKTPLLFNRDGTFTYGGETFDGSEATITWHGFIMVEEAERQRSAYQDGHREFILGYGKDDSPFYVGKGEYR